MKIACFQSGLILLILSDNLFSDSKISFSDGNYKLINLL